MANNPLKHTKTSPIVEKEDPIEEESKVGVMQPVDEFEQTFNYSYKAPTASVKESNGSYDMVEAPPRLPMDNAPAFGQVSAETLDKVSMISGRPQ
mmetsp:Transcript_8532/g.13164  ORF Transcript_8532/g.13164 Transcript_8532/m.13164 type:complete len:95 (+) Transcript_8532:1998-2282(+)